MMHVTALETFGLCLYYHIRSSNMPPNHAWETIKWTTKAKGFAYNEYVHTCSSVFLISWPIPLISELLCSDGSVKGVVMVLVLHSPTDTPDSAEPASAVSIIERKLLYPGFTKTTHLFGLPWGTNTLLCKVKKGEQILCKVLMNPQIENFRNAFTIKRMKGLLDYSIPGSVLTGTIAPSDEKWWNCLRGMFTGVQKHIHSGTIAVVLNKTFSFSEPHFLPMEIERKHR